MVSLQLATGADDTSQSPVYLSHSHGGVRLQPLTLADNGAALDASFRLRSFCNK